MAVVLTGANVIGFTKCSKQASKQIRDMATSAITTGLTVRHPIALMNLATINGKLSLRNLEGHCLVFDALHDHSFELLQKRHLASKSKGKKDVTQHTM